MWQSFEVTTDFMNHVTLAIDHSIEHSFGPNSGEATHSYTIFGFLIITPTPAVITKGDVLCHS